jgi:L-arabinonolactonase
MSEVIRLVLDCRNQHGEGPVWVPSSETLLWTDIETPALNVFNTQSGTHEEIHLEQKLGSFAIIDERTILAAFSDTIAVYDWVEKSTIRGVPIEQDIDGTRMNDGRTDRQGRFVVSGFDPKEEDRAGIYHVNEKLHITPWFRGISSGNSICFSPDGSIMYFADSPEAKMWAFDYDSDLPGITNKRLIYDFMDEPGLPDGSVVDSEGYIWNAEWNGSRIVRISPDGVLDRVVEVPVKNPTCIAFGGGDLKTLYITTSRLMLSESELESMPTSGSLYALDIDVAGIADVRFTLRK